LWRAWADDVRGSALDGGHFFPEEMPDRTAQELGNFFTTLS
jgi:haloacetate dehalogenase